MEEKGDITGQVFMNVQYSGEFATHRLEDPFFELCFELFGAVRVFAAFFPEADFAALLRLPAALPPSRPPFFAGAVFIFFPRPEPLFFPPPVIALTVAHALLSASPSGTPRSS